MRLGEVDRDVGVFEVDPNDAMAAVLQKRRGGAADAGRGAGHHIGA
ncbi:hypothetical protein [Demequina litorisediminis]